MSERPARTTAAASRTERSAPSAEGTRARWARAYLVVLAALALDILLLWWLTERYR
ncbi:MAG TPA: hypothetical protein VN896_11425 [Methylomirabilota bacterium]|nr:hypothetical protein [Methylomirabilota bacterium]